LLLSFLARQLDWKSNRDVFLVDPSFTREQVQRVGGWVEHSGKRLAFIYATHGRVSSISSAHRLHNTV
jgi:hypothetical protein